MSFPSTFGAQVAAIMDVLAKAAVAEITKLVEDGTVVLRLEMCRRDTEIQELKRSLNLMEVQLCKAQEAATILTTEDKQEPATARSQAIKTPTGDKETQELCAVYLEQHTADSLCKPQHEIEENYDMRPVVKHEPEDEPAVQETTDNSAASAANDDLVWSLPACSTFEKSPVPVQQDVQTFSSHRNTESSYNSSPTATEVVADDSLSVSIKVEDDDRPLCMENPTESVHNDHFRHVSWPSLSQDQCLQSALPQAGLSLELPHEQRSTVDAQDHILSRNNLRPKRLMNVWRTNQKLFVCSVCNKGFPRLFQLEEHKSTHQPFKPFRCLECGKSFTQKTRLKTHQSVHTGERPFSCKICGKMFSRQDNCLRHERFHSGLKPYSCGQCGKSFTVLGNLKIHQEIHLQGR